MQTFSANEAKVNFGAFLDAARREPGRVTRRDGGVGVMVSAEDYKARGAFYANRLQHTLAETGAHAAAQGLTAEGLGELLADES